MKELKHRLKIIVYIVQKLTGSTRQQIGTTTIQKLIFLLNRKGVTDYNYKMYHYGPYSIRVSQDVIIAGITNLLTVNWIENKGYDIKIKSGERLDTIKLSKSTTDEIDQIVEKYGNFKAVDLSLIATAYYVLDNIKVETDHQLISIVASLKPNYSGIVAPVLKKAGVIPISKTN
jgi:uncharacterized protein YwgA